MHQIPQDSPIIIEPEDVLTGTITCRWSLRLNLAHSKTLGNGNMSNRVSPRFDIIELILDRHGNQDEGSDRNDGSQCRSLILTLIYGDKENWLSSTRILKPARKTKSSSIDEDQSKDERHSTRLQWLEIDVCLALERLKQAQEEPEDEQSKDHSPHRRNTSHCHINSDDVTHQLCLACWHGKTRV